MANAVLDSFAILAFLFQEKGYEKVALLLEKAAETGQTIFVSAVNWAEVRYVIERKIGPGQWTEVSAKIQGLPIEVVPVDQKLAEAAGEIKALKRMSLADCFAAALAQSKGGEIYTGDPEFRSLGPDWRVVWL